MDKVPTMTSNTEPSGKCSASSEINYTDRNHLAYVPFDGHTNGHYNYSWWGNHPAWIQYEFVNPIKLYIVDIAPGADSSGAYAKNFTVLGSNDGTTFDAIYTGQVKNSYDVSNALLNRFIVDNDNHYKYIRISFPDKWNNDYYYIRINKLQFYGRHQAQ